MKTILKYVSRNIIEKKGRSLLIIFSLIIASTVMILNLTIPNQIVEANKNKTRDLVGISDVVIGGLNYFNMDDIKTNKEKINYVGVNQGSVIHKDKTLMLYGTNIKEAAKQKLVTDVNLSDDEVIINKNTAKKFNYHVNDIIKIKVEDETYKLKVKSIEESKGLLYFKTYALVMNDNTYSKLFETTKDKYMTYYVDVLNDENIDSYSTYIKNHNKDYFTQELVDEEAIKDNNAYVSLILIIIFVMAVIMIFFVVSTLNKMIIMERTPVIATFRSIGATKKRMNGLLVLENAMYGLIGGIIGALISILVNNFCVKLLLGGDELKTTVPFENLVIGVIFAIILEILMSIGAIIKSNKYSIKQLMFDNPSSRYELSKATSIISVICIISSILMYYFVSDEDILIDLLKITLFWIGVALSVPLIMLLLSKICSFIARKLNNGSLVIASKNLGYNKMIISSSRLVVIAIAIMLVIFNLSATFNNMLDSFSYQFGGYDIFIRETSKANTEYQKLEDLKEIKNLDLDYMATTDKAYNGKKKLKTPPIVLGMKKGREDIVELDYKISDLQEDEVLVDKKYLDSNNWKIGDTINLKMDGYKGTHKFKIVGTIDSFYYSVQREVMVINQKYFLDNFTTVPFQVVLSANKGVDLKDLVKKLELELKDPDIVIMTVDEFVESQRQNINTIMYLFYVIVGIVLVLSFVSIINNQIISFMERTKELAVLNSICMSKHQLNVMLIVENILSNIVACIIGFVASIMSVKLINSVLNGIKLFINVKFDMTVALTFIGIIIIVLFMTVIMPIVKLRKINVVEAIKYE